MPNKPAKAVKPIDLSDYEEEKVPFDDAIRRIASAKPVHKVAPKPKKKASKK